MIMWQMAMDELAELSVTCAWFVIFSKFFMSLFLFPENFRKYFKYFLQCLNGASANSNKIVT